MTISAARRVGNLHATSRARLESMTKELGVPLVVSADALGRRIAGDAWPLQGRGGELAVLPDRPPAEVLAEAVEESGHRARCLAHSCVDFTQ
jgi:hypothetical protein